MLSGVGPANDGDARCVNNKLVTGAVADRASRVGGAGGSNRALGWRSQNETVEIKLDPGDI